VGIVDDVRAAAVWIAAALTSSGYRADLSPSSLWDVERFFDEQAKDGSARPQGLLSEGLGARLFGLGAYLGEVIRRDLGGAWHGDDSDPQAEINVAVDLPGGVRIWPVQRVMKRFKNGPEDNIAHYAVALGVDIGPRPAPPLRRPYPG
jgi:hypothetical protein